MTGFSSTAMAMAMIACFLLAIGGVRLLIGKDRRRGGLMLTAAAVLLANVLIWTL